MLYFSLRYAGYLCLACVIYSATKFFTLLDLHISLSCVDYGSSFPDVVQGLEHVLESFCSNNSSSHSNFKHRDNLEKQVSFADAYIDFTCSKTCFTAMLKIGSFLQLTFTALHIFGFVSPKDDQSLKDFLIKVRDSFLCIIIFVDI